MKIRAVSNTEFVFIFGQIAAHIQIFIVYKNPNSSNMNIVRSCISSINKVI